jgi:G3E family GTPase
VTKTDLAPAAQVDSLERRLREINPRALFTRALNGEVDPAFLVDVGLTNTKSRLEEVERWLGDDEKQGHHEDEHGHHHHHDEAITTFTLRFDKPLAWQAFTQTIEVLTALRGPDLLRVKGLVNVEGKSGPMVVQGVQHLFHPPIELAAWPGPDHTTRLVFITKGIPRQTVENLFSAIGAIGGAR